MHPLVEFVYMLFYLIYCYIDAVISIFVPAKKKSFSGKLVLITGAGHGIGRELALQFGQLGARLVLLDINKANNESVAAELREAGSSVSTYVCDVSRLDSIRETASSVKRDVGDVEVLVNNAGILHGGALLKLSEADIRRTMDINIMAYIWTCREFLPSIIAKNEGHIVNVASMAGKGGVAYLTDYSASKFAVTGFTEALADEMRREGHHGIRFTTVFPMFVNTGLTVHMRDRFGRWLSAEEVAKAIIDGAQRNQPHVFIPPKLETQLRIGMLLPKKFQRKMVETMDLGIDPQYGEKRD